MKIIIAILILISIFSLVGLSYAQQGSAGTGQLPQGSAGTGQLPQGGAGTGQLPQGGAGTGGGLNLPQLENPLGNISTIPDLLNRVATQLIILAAPLLAIMIIWGALNILTAAGDPGKVEKGKKIILYSCIGFAIILVSKGIAAVIQQILS